MSQATTLRAFADLGARADQVGGELAHALATLCCRQQHGQREPCSACGDLGAALTRAVARALVAVAVRDRAGKVTLRGAEAVGRGLEELEIAAGLRAPARPSQSRRTVE